MGEMRSGDALLHGFIRDLTERQQTGPPSRSSRRSSCVAALGEMASTLAHEINQPLTAIADYLKVAAASCSAWRATRLCCVPSARRPTRRCGPGRSSATREFVARGESERHIENLPKLIEEASALALVGAKEKGVRVSFRFDPGAPPRRRPHPSAAGPAQSDPGDRGHARRPAPGLVVTTRACRRRVRRDQRLGHRHRHRSGDLRASCSSRSSRPRRTGWASVCRSAARSSNRTAAFPWSRKPTAAPPSGSP